MKTSLTSWDPFRDLDTFSDRLSRAMGGRAWPGDGETALAQADWNPAADITEDEHEFLVKVDLPEVKKDEVKVMVENGVLSISGERKFEHEEKDEKKKVHRIERSYGSYMRSFRLPETVDAEELKAEFKEGVLSVHLPKCEETKPRQIEVKVH
tara:strand:+ start:5479 stop:5937 length:459 start_codon:yes stop_codon:yes gene_type:complete